LVGDNGAGKSTLLKILAGTVTPDEGEILLDGEPVSFRSPHEATEAGIATVYQDLALALDLDVTSNFFLGREASAASGPRRWVGWLDRRRMRKETREALDRVHINIPDLNKEAGLLSGGQRQAIAIARAVNWCDRILLLDEPTAALGVEQQREVINLIEKVTEMGIATVLVSHQLPHVLEVADEVVVLRRGRLTATLTAEQASAERLLGLITGLEGSNAHQPRPATEASA
ncbi:MAG TPA: ATP-binding cassette domain-containing protein, partial [Solirubrobacterales bacterium]